jgi:hypothetical protein
MEAVAVSAKKGKIGELKKIMQKKLEAMRAK